MWLNLAKVGLCYESFRSLSFEKPYKERGRNLITIYLDSLITQIGIN